MRLLSLNRSLVKPLMTLDGRSVPSGIDKRPTPGTVPVGSLGLEGDAQADASVHGGPSKALYAYPSEHYPFWQTVRSQAKQADWGAELAPGAMGENLTLAGLLEAQVWIGDRLVFPNCELVVSEPRLPCFKFNASMGFPHAVKLMAQSGYCGYYLAVLKPGTLSADQAFTLQPGPREVGIAELFKQRMSKS